GRFNPQKNYLFLIDVLTQIRGANWTMTMIGDGPQMPLVTARIAERDLQNRIELRGWLDEKNVESELKNSDVFLMPSTSEGLSVAAVEALKFGLAVVGSDIGGLID